MIINKSWAMPNSRTFKIKPIKELILKYVNDNLIVLDPFANECNIKKFLPKGVNYISNDIDYEYETDYHLDAFDFLKQFNDNSIDIILYDPPYSNRQVSECYKKLGKTVTMKDTSSAYFTKFKNEIARVIKQNGLVISFGWNTNGIGKSLGFEQIEILLVAHGGGTQ